MARQCSCLRVGFAGKVVMARQCSCLTVGFAGKVVMASVPV